MSSVNLSETFHISFVLLAAMQLYPTVCGNSVDVGLLVGG